MGLCWINISIFLGYHGSYMGVKQSVTFIIDGRLPGANELIHATNINRFSGASIKKKWTTYCWTYAKTVKWPKWVYPLKVHLKWVEPNCRRDPDNIRFGAKFIFDGLVQGELIENDSQKIIKEITDTFLFVGPNQSKEGWIEVTIAEI